jgi:hypothetical protein
MLDAEEDDIELDEDMRGMGDFARRELGRKGSGGDAERKAIVLDDKSYGRCLFEVRSGEGQPNLMTGEEVVLRVAGCSCGRSRAGGGVGIGRRQLEAYRCPRLCLRGDAPTMRSFEKSAHRSSMDGQDRSGC